MSRQVNEAGRARLWPDGALDRAALVVVDAQTGFGNYSFWGPRNNPKCEGNIRTLLDKWRASGRPVVLVKHNSRTVESPLHPSNPGNALYPWTDGRTDLLVTKEVNSSFHGSPDLAAWLTNQDIKDIVVCGITTNHCCETTARVGANLGFTVYFVLDATHTFDRAAPDGSIASASQLAHITATNLHQEFATIVQTNDLIRA